MPGTIRIHFGLLGTGLLAASLGALATGPAPAAPPDLATQMGNMAGLAVMIERAVEVYLGLTGLNGPDRGSAAEAPPASGIAIPAALALGLLVALAGVRILPSLALPAAQGPMAALRNGLDVLLSGALMGGGSMLAHEVAEAMKGGMRRLGG